MRPVLCSFPSEANHFPDICNKFLTFALKKKKHLISFNKTYKGKIPFYGHRFSYIFKIKIQKNPLSLNSTDLKTLLIKKKKDPFAFIKVTISRLCATKLQCYSHEHTSHTV